jgi:hypothetical protein
MCLREVSASQALPVGSWWKLKGSYVWTFAYLEGNFKSILKTIGNYTVKVLVTDQDSNTTNLLKQEEYSERIIVGGWCEANVTKVGDACKSSWYEKIEYTIASDTLDVVALHVVAVGGAKTRFEREGIIGYRTEFLVDPTKLTEGGTSQWVWPVPNGDAKGSTFVPVDFSVGTQRMNIKGVPLKVLTLTYTGDALSLFLQPHKDSTYVYSKGRETDMYLYDSVYGIRLGSSKKFTTGGENFAGGRMLLTYDGAIGLDCVGGNWTEDYSEDALLEDTNLSFRVPQVTSTTVVRTSTTLQITTVPTSTAIIPATVTVTTKESAPIDFAVLSMVMSVVAISVVSILAVVVLRRRNKPD